MSVGKETSSGPTGSPAHTVAWVSRAGTTAVTMTQFEDTPEVGVGIGTRNLLTGDTVVVVLTPEDTEELRQQLNAWYGRKATLIEVSHG